VNAVVAISLPLKEREKETLGELTRDNEGRNRFERWIFTS